MKYEKLPLSFEAQAELLIQRGLIADKSLLVNRLKNVNYYRLSAYLYPYRQDVDNFKPDTDLEKVWRHYTFDRHLRLMTMDAIERVEISIRTQLIYSFAHTTNAFGYTDSKALPQLNTEKYERLINEIKKEISRSRETFVEHFKKKYGDVHDFLPLWMAGEIISFGCTMTIYRGVATDVKKQLAGFYNIPDDVLRSWLKTINMIRNICAHHGRLWNRELGVKPFGVKPRIPRKNKYPEWHEPIPIPQNRIFSVLTILRYLLQIIAPQSKWENRLFTLFDEYSEISRWNMGFPDNWKESLLWK
ncbi:Abi family protein [bacterium]